ncbi:MAG: hypothetical protein M1818_007432 [Claussenomyces sp. TS43310]|nr:MAG: hypothetical protein M1818_007432 [Claussenomyces sp. TS43310]
MEAQVVTVRLADDFQSWWSERKTVWIESLDTLRSKHLGGEVKSPEAVDIIRATTINSPAERRQDLRAPSQYFDIKQSAKGGLGAFAVTSIPKDTIILSEGLLIQGKTTNFLEAFDRLSSSKQAQFMRLHAYDRLDTNKVLAIFKTNRFAVSNTAAGIFLVASRFNHSCHPLCTYLFDVVNQKLVLTTTNDIPAGQEITISYGYCASDLLECYGFLCDCGHCYLPPDQDILNGDSLRKLIVTRYEGKYDEEWRQSGQW